MKDEDQNRTYKVKLLCRNCDKEWIEDVEKGIYIRYEKDNNYMIKPGDSYKNRILFKCPNCGANKKIARLSLT
jgi:predicted RNA-binding Zn-ribbon protein involved in translation (DUF1610 family)